MKNIRMLAATGFVLLVIGAGLMVGGALASAHGSRSTSDRVAQLETKVRILQGRVNLLDQLTANMDDHGIYHGVLPEHPTFQANCQGQQAIWGPVEFYDHQTYIAVTCAAP